MSDKQIAFVASGQIPPSAPPPASTGPVGWLRDNLFDGWFNTILTLVSIALLVWMIPAIVQWAFVDGVWNAVSLKECRANANVPGLLGLAGSSGVAIDMAAFNALEGLVAQEAFLRNALGEAGAAFSQHQGACWAVIVERFDQFIYGFYPHEERWRPNLAFLLLIAAIVPALFDNVPHRALGLVFSAIYPIVAYFLIWGGTTTEMLAVLLVIAVVFGAFAALNKGLSKEAMASAAVIGGSIVLLLLLHLALGLEPVSSRDIGGFLLATIIGVAGIVLSLPIGILLALGRRSSMPYIQTVCICFIEFIRGVPLITLLFVANSVLAYFFPPGSNLDLILRVVIMVTLFASAYMAEVIRGGLAALPPGQYEAADSLGLNYWKSMRLIILPQALKISIPNIVSSFIGLFKDTTLVVVIGLLDPIGLINTTRADSAWNGIIWEFYVFVGLFFFVVCFGMSRYSMYLERKLKTDR